MTPQPGARPGSTSTSPRRLLATLWLGNLFYAAPDFPGRSHLLMELRRFARRFDSTVTGSFGGGLRHQGNPGVDASTLEPMFLRYIKPTLAPILEAALPRDGVFVDIGANVGVYTLWGARCVGTGGLVHAFEPVPATRARLERNVALNRFDHVRIVAKGLGAAPGAVTLYQASDTSGRSSRYLSDESRPVEVEITTLDHHLAGERTPQLVKIDVEGMELEVLRGAPRLLNSSEPPFLVLEANAGHLAAAGTSYPGLADFLRGAGYAIWSLGRRGLQPEAADAARPGSPDVVAARGDVDRHVRVLDMLQGVRFRDQEIVPRLARIRALLGSAPH